MHLIICLFFNLCAHVYDYVCLSPLHTGVGLILILCERVSGAGLAGAGYCSGAGLVGS